MEYPNRTNLFKPSTGVVIAIVVASLLVGCGDGRPARVPVAGQVLIDHEPLRYGSIRFIPPSGRASVGKLDEDGRFKLACFEPEDGALIGTHQVEITAGESLSPTSIHWHAPKKYASHHTSGLVVEVDQPTDSVVINLTWDGGSSFVERLDSDEDGPRQRKSTRN